MGTDTVAIIILFLLWSILFARFDKHNPISRTRALFWEIAHWPLHFMLLLLLAAIVVSRTRVSTTGG